MYGPVIRHSRSKLCWIHDIKQTKSETGDYKAGYIMIRTNAQETPPSYQHAHRTFLTQPSLQFISPTLLSLMLPPCSGIIGGNQRNVDDDDTGRMVHRSTSQSDDGDVSRTPTRHFTPNIWSWTGGMTFHQHPSDDYIVEGARQSRLEDAPRRMSVDVDIDKDLHRTVNQ